MTRVAALVVVLAAALAPGCQPPVDAPDARQRDGAPDAAPPPWWTPAPGEVNDWDIQLHAPFNVTTPRIAYILNLWDVVPEGQSITYTDGSTLPIPKGLLAKEMLDLHAQRPRTIVICRVDAGAIDLVNDPDAMKFPGYEATPPDAPTAPAAASVIGWSTTLPANMRWLDVRNAFGGAAVLPLIQKRFELAKAIGCDAILPDHVDMYGVKSAGDGTMEFTGTGFAPQIMFDDQIAYYIAMATSVHATQQISIGFRGPFDQASSPDVQQQFDWALAVGCGESDNCTSWSQGGFPESVYGHKAVLALDFDHIVDMRGPGQFCNSQNGAQLTDGIIKDEALTSMTWTSCDPVVMPDAGP